MLQLLTVMPINNLLLARMPANDLIMGYNDYMNQVDTKKLTSFCRKYDEMEFYLTGNFE